MDTARHVTHFFCATAPKPNVFICCQCGPCVHLGSDRGYMFPLCHDVAPVGAGVRCILSRSRLCTGLQLQVSPHVSFRVWFVLSCVMLFCLSTTAVCGHSLHALWVALGGITNSGLRPMRIHGFSRLKEDPAA